MTLKNIVIDLDARRLNVAAENIFGVPVRLTVESEQLGDGGLQAILTLQEIVNRLAPADPPAGLLEEITGLERRLAELKAQAGISQPEVLL